jgi:transcriptional regulator with XRE-family HTH domain
VIFWEYYVIAGTKVEWKRKRTGKKGGIMEGRYPNFLKEAIRERGYKLYEVAARLYISDRTLRNYCAGIRPVPDDVLQALAKLLDCPIAVLRYGTQEEGDAMDLSRRGLMQLGVGVALAGLAGELGRMWGDDLLVVYARGIAACQDLYAAGNTQVVEALLPLYASQTGQLAQERSALQKQAAALACQAHLIACELATDREDFVRAQRAGKLALTYGRIAGDNNLQVAALIRTANIGFHRKDVPSALSAYQRAVSLFNGQGSALLRGRVYAGMAEVYAMGGDLQESMQAMGLAYEHYPLKPEKDPASAYLRTSRYSLYVFGDAQSRLFLGQPKEADRALVAVQKEYGTLSPIRQVDLLYYQTEVQQALGEMEESGQLLLQGAGQAKALGSLLYFNKFVQSYGEMKKRWPHEMRIASWGDALRWEQSA